MIEIPNWCYNTLVISGSPDELKRFKIFAECKTRKETGFDVDENYHSLFDFDNFISPEEDKKRLIESWNSDPKIRERWVDFGQYWFNHGGYEWCVENQGTKWNPRDISINESDNELTYSFDTAWSPPTPVIAKASELFPDLTFVLHMEEESHAYGGSETYKAGELIDEDVREQTNTACPHCGEDISHWADENLCEVECWECGKYLGDDVEGESDEDSKQS